MRGHVSGRKWGGLSTAFLMAAVAGTAYLAPAMARPEEQNQAPGTQQAPTPDEIKKMMAGGPGGEAGDKQPDFKPFAEVSKDYEKVNSSADGQASLYTLWVREKDGQMLAELPRGWQGQKHLIATTMPTGEIFAGLQAGDYYVYWKRFDKRLALIMPNVDVRSTGDRESKDSIQNHFVDRVLVDVPIECMGPGGQPVIDLDALLVQQAGTFYGGMAAGLNARLATVKSAKAFPKNVEVSFEAPAAGGRLKTFHYSWSLIEETPGYQPRVADERVGYFTTEYRDLGKFRDDQVTTRYINRWHLEKADPKLKMSPPKEPIVFYVEHTVPVRYRRWVKEGVLYWNKAFENIGIKDAIEVYYQDKATGAHMDKDPEDVRYNFVRWLSNDIGTAIGPSRPHPITGQILDADVVLTDGWIRHFWYQANELLPQTGMSIMLEGVSPETLAWYDTHPNWDPRVRMSPPEKRNQIMVDRARRGVVAYGGIGIGTTDATLMGNEELARVAEFVSPRYGLCMASEGMARDMQVAGLYMEVAGLLEDYRAAPASGAADDKKDDAKKDDKKDEAKKDESELIDGVPEWFVGPALAHLTVHEIGHTLGLRHNFKASSQYTFAQINSPEMKGKGITASVMDYTPVNICMDEKLTQGDFNQIGIGDYDMWVIEYGYGFGDTKKTLEKVNQPGHMYATDEDTGGPDPLARRYDFAADPLSYADNLARLAKFSRSKIVDKFVKDGDSWSRARKGYEITLNTQINAVNIMSNWLGGSDIVRDRKGDPGSRQPVTPIPVETQRAALKFVIENSFSDDAFGLTPDLLARMSVNKNEAPGTDATWSVHDRISGIQASVLSSLINPTKLRRVYDNELYIAADKDALTLPELMDTVSIAIWGELDKTSGSFTNRQPMVSSLRRNLQREHVERLIDLTIEPGSNAAGKTISTLAMAKLRELDGRLESVLKKDGIDAYTKAHLSEAKVRISKALDAGYILNGGGGSFEFPAWMFMGQDTQTARQAEDLKK